MEDLRPVASFRLAAFDLDGTLFGADAQITGATVSVLRRVAAQGIHLVAATGRSHTTAGPRLAHTQAVEWAVCSNGATLYHVPSDTVIEHRTMNNHDVEPLVASIRGTLPEAVFGWEATGTYQWTEGFNILMNGYLAQREVVPDDHPLPTEVVKFFIAHPTIVRYELLSTLKPIVPQHLTLSTAGTTFLEATGAGVNKATGLARLCERVEVDADQVVAFGDNMNDLEMLSWAGRGYAMANAHHEVVAATTHRTRLPYTEDGVADTLSDLFLG